MDELLAIFRRGYPVPLPDADILTEPGREPLKLNDDERKAPVYVAHGS